MAYETYYRSHTCNDLRASDVGQTVRLCGWVSRVRDLGRLKFITLRDPYGITQLIIPDDAEAAMLKTVEHLHAETVIFVEGQVLHRQKDVNKELPTGEIEVQVNKLEVDFEVKDLPFPLNEIVPNEELRLKYRFLDLRRERLHRNIILRSKVMYAIRQFMVNRGFTEIHTPILTASSPEGARDYVVPSRVHPGKFYALPQAPQQYKQLLMCSGFDKYFQIAPCFRDEDARADRSPGEFYQLDIEMAFIQQDDLFYILEGLFQELTDKVSNKKIVANPFPHIKYMNAINHYGTDKPDLRYDLRIEDGSRIFEGSKFRAFAANAVPGKCVKAIVAKGCADRPRSFFDKLEKLIKKQGGKGLAYLNFREDEVKSAIAKFLSSGEINRLREQLHAETGDSVLLCAGDWAHTCEVMGMLRIDLATQLDLIDHSKLAFCWIVDFPMFEWDEAARKIDFSHNPFSMPQGGMEALENEDPLNILAYQYDIVCNGIELSSGAIRNHRPDIMYKAFEIVGYSRADVDREFGHMIDAFKYGAPPHGGLAPGLDRIVMIYADEPNIREVIAFPMNQRVQELMMGAPREIPARHLKELHLQIVKAEEEAKS